MRTTSPGTIAGVLHDAAAAAKVLEGGTVAAYIPALRDADPEVFALAYASIDGERAATGGVEACFSLQSVSKPFVFAVVCQQLGSETAARLVGQNSTGQPFDSRATDHTNPMVNAGALIASSLVAGETAEQKSQCVIEALSRFAGRTLVVDAEVLRSESENNQSNRAIAKTLAERGLLACSPEAATEVYTLQCAITVTARDLSVMGATLASSGVNPLSRDAVVGPEACRRVLASLATAGLYELSGEWFSETGLFSKSGVSGGLLSIVPNVGALAAYSARIDKSGMSVRGALATKLVARQLHLGIFDAVWGVSRRAS